MFACLLACLRLGAGGLLYSLDWLRTWKLPALASLVLESKGCAIVPKPSMFLWGKKKLKFFSFPLIILLDVVYNFRACSCIGAHSCTDLGLNMFS